MILVYLIPLLLAVEYRVRLGPASFAVAELSVPIVWIIALQRQGRADQLTPPAESPYDTYLVFLVFLFSIPGLIFDINARHAVSALRDLSLPILLFWGIRALRLKPVELKRLVQTYLAMALASALLGIIQFRTGRFAFFESVEAAQWEQYKLGFIVKTVVGDWLGARDALPIGLFAHANNFGTYITIPLVVAFAGLFFKNRHPRDHFWLQAVGVILMFLALTGTFFRTGIVVVLLCMVVLAGIRRHDLTGSWRLLVVSSLVVLTLFGFMFATPDVFAFDEFGTLSGRTEMIQHATQVIAMHPWMVLTGGLTDDYKRIFDEPQEVHNWLLYGTLRFGIAATVCLAVFYFMWIRRFSRISRRTHGGRKAILAGAALGLAGNIFVYGLTTSLLDNVSVNLGFMFWFGVAATAYDQQQREPQPAGTLRAA